MILAIFSVFICIYIYYRLIRMLQYNLECHNYIIEAITCYPYKINVNLFIYLLIDWLLIQTKVLVNFIIKMNEILRFPEIIFVSLPHQEPRQKFAWIFSWTGHCLTVHQILEQLHQNQEWSDCPLVWFWYGNQGNSIP